MKQWAEKKKFPRPSDRAFAERAGMWFTNIKDKRIQNRHARKRSLDEAFEDDA